MAKRVEKKQKAIDPNAVEKLHDFINTTMLGYPNPDRKSNDGRLLHEIWLWQEVAAFASDAEKAAWRVAQAGDDSLVPSDDELRESPNTETIVADSGSYACTVKCDPGSRNFDRDTFIALVSRRYDIPAAKLMKIAEEAKKATNARLTKRVLAMS